MPGRPVHGGVNEIDTRPLAGIDVDARLRSGSSRAGAGAGEEAG